MRHSYEETTRHYAIIDANKQKLNEAFKLLRKNKILARQNFSCCGSCGSYELATKIEEMHDANKSVLGYVFYNRQSNEALVGDHWKLADGRLYISYADSSTSKYPNKITKTSEEIGQMLVVALTQVGLVFEWDGSSDSCVLVKMAEKTVEKVEADSETWGE